MPELTPAVNNQMLPDVFTSKVLEQPRVCIVDEEQRVQLGWESSLGPRVKLFYFSSPEELLNYEKAHSFFLDSMVCIITSRLFNQKTSDIVQSDFPRQLREKTNAPIFLNWQGYIDKNELERHFDGKIYQRYGVKWITLKHRIMRIGKSRQQYLGDQQLNVHHSFRPAGPSREHLCMDLLKKMAENAEGSHKARLEYYIFKDIKTGIMLLEAVYNRLMTSKEIPATCPSRYLNSSPVIAARILEQALIKAAPLNLTRSVS